jgi:hypothetical protein
MSALHTKKRDGWSAQALRDRSDRSARSAASSVHDSSCHFGRLVVLFLVSARVASACASVPSPCIRAAADGWSETVREREHPRLRMRLARGSCCSPLHSLPAAVPGRVAVGPSHRCIDAASRALRAGWSSDANAAQTRLPQADAITRVHSSSPCPRRFSFAALRSFASCPASLSRSRLI